MKQPTLNGEILECYAGGKFLVRLEDGTEIKAYLSGKMRLAKVRVNIGDTVAIILDPAGWNATNRVVWRK